MNAPARSRAAIHDDINTALILAEHCTGTDPAARILERLRGDIENLLPDAERAAARLPDGTRMRDVGLSSCGFARELLHKGTDAGDGPEHRLRMWAKTASILLAYAAQPPTPEHKASCPARGGAGNPDNRTVKRS